MDRRLFIQSLAALASGAGVIEARAGTACGPFVPPGIQQCESGISSAVAEMTANTVGGQHASQWCWAACISMVFEYYGHPVAQERIVDETWGGLVNNPGQPYQILQNLNRQWVDDIGRSFIVSGDSFSANHVTAAQDLALDMPLIVGTLGHAVVLTALTYVRDFNGNGNVIAATVRDPWPGRGRRILTAQEWYEMSFAARIRVF